MLRVSGWFGLGFVVALPVSILLWLDYGRELRAIPHPSRARRLLVFFVGVPQVLFGLLSLVAGVLIVVWVLYNSLWKRLPEYSGGFLGFGVGPVLTLFGFGLIADAFRKSRPPNEA
jgi:urea transporter